MIMAYSIPDIIDNHKTTIDTYDGDGGLCFDVEQK